MTTPDERKFLLFRRGDVRDDIILSNYRNSLRTLVDPDTGATFTEDTVIMVTARGSSLFIEADGVDLFAQANQARARYLANQLRPTWSNTAFLADYHGPLWLGEQDPYLPATGGSGQVTGSAPAGTVFTGSNVLGDPTAAVAVDPNGKQYQLLATTTVPVGADTVALELAGVDLGSDTNPQTGTILTWSANKPVGADDDAPVATSFSGGFDKETDKELADRIEQFIAYRPASGNPAHFVNWARAASNAVESAFVYPCGFYSGSVLVCLLQKRGTATGPDARTDVAPATLIAARNYLVPPDSPVVPQRAYVVVVPPNEEDADLVMRFSMGQGTTGGWADTTPWPAYSSSYPAVIVASVTSQTEFVVTTNDDLPGGAASLTGDDAPQLMLWDEENSVFEELDVLTVTDAGTAVTIELNAAPTMTIAAGQYLSPYTDRESIISDAVEDYFDELGPGEVVDLDTDPRAARAFRYPPPTEQYPSIAGQLVVSRVIDALGGVAPNAELTSISQSEPTLPGDIVDGPNIITLGKLGIYPL